MGKTHAVLGSPALWLSLLTASAIAAACGSADSHKQTLGDEGGAGGSAGARATGAAAGSTSGGAAGESAGPLLGDAGSAGEAGAAQGGAGGAMSNDDTPGGAGGTSNGCLALYFGDDLDTVQIVDTTIPDFGAAGTIELWILLDADGDALVHDGGLFNKWVNFQEDKFFYVNGNGSVSVYFAQQAANFTSAPAVVPSQWQHVAMSYDATSARIYVDGIKVGEQAGVTAPVNSNGNIQIGHIDRDNVHPALHGFYSEVRLSNVARYTSDFTPAAHLAPDADTVGLWKLDEGSGQIATDASSLDNPGTIGGAEWQLAPCR